MQYRVLWLASLVLADALILWDGAPPAAGVAAMCALIFFLPGSAAVAALFPHGDALDSWERLGIGGAVGLGLSLQATWLIMLTPGGISGIVLLAVLNGLTLALGIGALWRLSRPSDAPTAAAMPRASGREHAIALVLLGIASVFSFLWSGYTEYDHDEAPVLSAVVDSIAGAERSVFTLLKGPAQIVLATDFALLGGDLSEWVLRAPFGLAGVLGALVLWRLSRRLAGAGAALAVLALWVVEGIHTGQNRWLQFQSLVLLEGIAAVWCYARALDETGSRRLRLHLLGAFLFGTSLFAHFAGAFAAPVLAYLWWLAERGALRRRATWLRASALALVIALVASPFYLLMLRQPSLAARMQRYYFGLRIGNPPYNNIGDFAKRLAILESPEWLLLIIAGLLLGGVVLGIAATRRTAMGGALWWIGFGGVVLANLFPALPIVSGTNLSFVPVVLLGLLLVLLDGLAVPLRLAGVWALGAWFYPAFWMQIPGDHFYGALPGICLLVVLGWQEARRRWAARAPAWLRTDFARAVALAFLVLWIAGAGTYTFAMYVWHRPEYAMRYPEAKAPLTLFDAERPPLLYGAYPHQSGWRAIAALYARGELRGEYAANELHAVSDWYLQKKWEPDRPRPRYYFEVVRPFAPILGTDVPPDLAQTHRLAGIVTVEGETRMRVHERLDVATPLPVQTWAVESLADDWREMASLSRFLAFETEGRDDTAFYSIAQRLDRDGQSGDIVLLDRALGRELLAKFYTGNLPLVVSPDDAAARGARRIWGVFWASPDRAGERAIAEHACVAASEWHKDVRLTLNGASPAGAAHTVGAQFESYARLQSAAIGEAMRGDILCVQLDWEALAPTDEPHKVFVHLLAPDGKVAAQFDTEPLAGFKPTDDWNPGEHFTERVGLALPADLPAGEYKVVAGLYSPTTGRRLAAAVSGAHVAGDAVPLGVAAVR